MIVLVGGGKGGTGKSTVSMNLAVWLAHAGRDVLLVDTDPDSRTSANWVEVRNQTKLPLVHCIQRYGDLFQSLQDYQDRYSEVVVDAGGADSEELRTALCVADRFLAPFQPSQADLWTVKSMEQVARVACGMNRGLKVASILTRCSTHHRDSDSKDAAELLGEYSKVLPLSQVRICERKIYKHAVAAGKGVFEMRKSKAQAKAAGEINELAMEVYGVEVLKRSSTAAA